MVFGLSGIKAPTIDSINAVYLKDWESHLEFTNADVNTVLNTRPPQSIKRTVTDTILLSKIQANLNIKLKPIRFLFERDFRLVLIVNYKESNNKDTIAFGNIIGMTINENDYVVNTDLLNSIVEYLDLYDKSTIIEYIREIKHIFNLE